MEFFTQAVNVLKILVTAIGAGLGAWGVKPCDTFISEKLMH
ncbi:MAG: hypothetical protein KH219_07725 [Peptoniphilus harei]|nr:hypothetical protein [Peptoniphilus harei]